MRKGAKQIVATQSTVFMSTPRKRPLALIGAEGGEIIRALIFAPDGKTFEKSMNIIGKPRTREYDRYVRRLEIAWQTRKRAPPWKGQKGRPRGSYKHPPEVRALAGAVVSAVREKREGRSRLPPPMVMGDFNEPLVRDLARRRGVKLNPACLDWLCNVAPKTGRFKT